MSEFRIGLITEGPTDQTVLEKIIIAAFPEDSFLFSYISPTEDEIKEAKKEEGFGWSGIYKVCKKLKTKLEIAEMGGCGFDLLIIHVDGDVMVVSYESGNIEPSPSDAKLPCFSETASITDNCKALKTVVESWMEQINRKIVHCIPFINTDIWAAYMLYSSKRELLSENLDKDNLNRILLSMSKKDGRLVRKKGDKIKKNKKVYIDACDCLSDKLLLKMRNIFTQLDLFCNEVSQTLEE